MPKPTHITCLCGDIFEPASILPFEELPVEKHLCHCNICRYSTGALCASYFELKGEPSAKSLDRATAYHTPKYVRYFCKNCGCNVFAVGKTDDNNRWLACSGTLETDRKAADDVVVNVSKITAHIYVGDAADGGIAPFLSTIRGQEVPCYEVEDVGTAMDKAQLSLLRKGPPPPPAEKVLERGDTLNAACHCGAVRFQIKPPAYDEKSEGWYVPPDRTKYYARLCCCRSCRLSIGFTMQPWAYVPPGQILTDDGQPVLFGPQHKETTQLGALRYYQSSDAVLRGFCSTCGATMLYQPFERPYIIDVSVGILRSKHGNTMAREWLDWDRTVVSKLAEAADDDLARAWMQNE
ncbi:hypothetical protein PV08_00371 [Exophiala spinifera]|uniref:CENP-V/GFA domain-containing protein n=1 Tax=Exophiala spinifera TaxID=91928 RepID=A0A0D1YWV5_9EURO|nr:uncharacterized protein PV08_00371 [Exophiala spinifera]KIW19796.1 hypothetical protein PV08_00371 [Exophiala spinifera]